MLLVFVLGTFGMNFQVTTALMATQEFDKGPTEYGVLGSIMAIGSLTAALLSARRGEPRLRVLLLALVLHLSTTGRHWPPYHFALALPLGFRLTALTTANSMCRCAPIPSYAAGHGSYKWRSSWRHPVERRSSLDREVLALAGPSRRPDLRGLTRRLGGGARAAQNVLCATIAALPRAHIERSPPLHVTEAGPGAARCPAVRRRLPGRAVRLLVVPLRMPS